MVFSQVILQTTTTDLTPILQAIGIPATELGLSGAAGYVIGKVLKTIAKIVFYIAAFFVAVELAAAAWLESIGAITVTINYDKITEISTTASTWLTSQLGTLTTVLSGLTAVSIGFASGFALGLTR